MDEIGLKVFSYAATLNVGRVDTINHVDILCVTGPINLKTTHAVVSGALQRFLAGAGSKRNHRLERA